MTGVGDGIRQGLACTVVYGMALRHTIPSLGWLVVKPFKLPVLRVHDARRLGVPDGPLMGELKRVSRLCPSPLLLPLAAAGTSLIAFPIGNTSMLGIPPAPAKCIFTLVQHSTNPIPSFILYNETLVDRIIDRYN